MSIETVNPADYIRPDGSIDVTPDNWPSPEELQRVRNAKWIRHCLDLLHAEDAPRA